MLWLIAAILPIVAYCQYEVEVLSREPRIYSVENFLTPAECDYLIEKALPQLKPSTVIVDNAQVQEVREGRSSKGAFLSKNWDPIVKQIDERIAELISIPAENGEDLYVLRYEEGGEYRPHYDFFDPETEGGFYCLQMGGQRIATVIIYLANTERGGGTYFPEIDLRIEPIKGNALIFFNCTPDGEEDFMTLHAGEPVEKGEKWIATKWIRSGSFH